MVSISNPFSGFKGDDWLQKLQKITIILPIFSVLITVVSFILYGLGYSFLYGFYLSGDGKLISPSIIELLTSPVPFNKALVFSVSFVIILITLFITLIIAAFKETKLANIFIILISFLIFHYGLTIFFIGSFEKSIIYALNFLIVWVVPIFVAITIYWADEFEKNTLISTSILFANILFVAVLISTLQVEKLILIYIPFCLVFTIAARKLYCYLETCTNFLLRLFLWLFLSFIYFIILFVLTFIFLIVFDILFGKVYLIVRFFLLLSIITSLILGAFPKTFDKINTYFNNKKIDNPPKLSLSIKAIIVLVLVIITITFLPTALHLTGHVTRTLLPDDSPLKNYRFNIEDPHNQQIIKSSVIILSSKDGTLYLSNDVWELEVLKQLSYSIKASDSTFPASDQK